MMSIMTNSDAIRVNSVAIANTPGGGGGATPAMVSDIIADIATNSNKIDGNMMSIMTTSDAVSTNAAGISTNSEGISTNKDMISSQMQSIS